MVLGNQKHSKCWQPHTVRVISKFTIFFQTHLVYISLFDYRQQVSEQKITKKRKIIKNKNMDTLTAHVHFLNTNRLVFQKPIQTYLYLSYTHKVIITYCMSSINNKKNKMYLRVLTNLFKLMVFSFLPKNVNFT